MRTPLHLAALQGDAASVVGLCTYKAKVNITDEHGLTPLHKAAAQGHNEAAEELLAHGANPNAKDEVGITADCSCWSQQKCNHCSSPQRQIYPNAKGKVRKTADWNC